MTAQQAVALVVRLFSIWLFVYSLRLYALVFAMSAQVKDGGAWIFVLLAMLTSGIALLIWNFPLYVADKLLPRTRHTNIIRMPGMQVAELATATLGLWAIIESIPGLMAFARQTQFPGFYFNFRELVFLAIPLAQISIGFFLLRKPRVVAEKVMAAMPLLAEPSES